MFGKLFGKSAKKPASLPPLSGGTASSILSVVGARGIPPMHGAAQKAFKLSTDPNAEARDFVEVIESDEGLSARIIKIANSVFFDRGKRATSIEDSVTVIGIEELRCILNATTLSELFPSRHALRAQLWSNDIATGIIARTLAKRIYPEKAEFAFLAGLMHDIGKLLLLQRAPDVYAKVCAAVEKEGISFAEAEGRILLFDHTEVGQLIGEKWSFSHDLIEAIRNHHKPLGAGVSKNPPVSAIVKCADTIAHSIGIGHPRGFNRFRISKEEALPALLEGIGIPRPDHKGALALFARTYESEYQLYVKGG